MSKNPNERRRQMFVSRPLQNRIILQVSWPPAVALVSTAVVLAYLCSRLSGEAIAAHVDLPSVVPLFLVVMAFLVVSTGFVLMSALKTSHRIAGPMYRLRKTLDAVREGDLGVRARLRSGDFLVELADDVNEFLDWLQAHPPTMAAEGAVDADAKGAGAQNAPVAVAVDEVPGLLEEESGVDAECGAGAANGKVERRGPTGFADLQE